MRVNVCVYARTHTHCTNGVLGCQPRSRDETPGGLEEYRGGCVTHKFTRKIIHIYMYLCICTHKYIQVCMHLYLHVDTNI